MVRIFIFGFLLLCVLAVQGGGRTRYFPVLVEVDTGNGRHAGLMPLSSSDPYPPFPVPPPEGQIQYPESSRQHWYGLPLPDFSNPPSTSRRQLIYRGTMEPIIPTEGKDPNEKHKDFHHDDDVKYLPPHHDPHTNYDDDERAFFVVQPSSIYYPQQPVIPYPVTYANMPPLYAPYSIVTGSRSLAHPHSSPKMARSFMVRPKIKTSKK